MLKSGTQSSVGAEYIQETMITPTKATIQAITVNWIPKALLASLMTVWATFVEDHAFPMTLLLLLMVVDTAFGVMAAVKAGQFSSRKFRNSAFKLLGFTVVIAVLHMLNFIIPMLDVAGVKVDTMVIMYFSAAEALSIFENVSVITGVEIPAVIRLIISKVVKKKP